jgi:hypothetical protein
MAISYAAYRVLLDLFPSRASDFSGFMTALGYDPGDTSTDPTLPQGIGNLAAKAVLDFRHRDGANQLADEPSGDPTKPYSDYTGYAPVNDWNRVSDVYRWQPLCVPTPPPGATSCSGTVQKFATPQWGRVTPFALTKPDQFGPPPLDRSELPTEAKQLVDTQADLDDLEKTIAYYWADGPGSELPPGHWAMIAAAASRAAGTSLDGNVKLFFALANGLPVRPASDRRVSGGVVRVDHRHRRRGGSEPVLMLGVPWWRRCATSTTCSTAMCPLTLSAWIAST